MVKCRNSSNAIETEMIMKDLKNGATTLSIMTLSIMTSSIKTLSIKGLHVTLIIMSSSITTLSIKGLHMTLSISNIQQKQHSAKYALPLC